MWRLWGRGEGSPDKGPDRGNEPHPTVNATFSAESEGRIIAPVFVNSVVHGSVSIAEASNVPGNLPDPEAIRKVIEDHKRQMLERYSMVFEGLVQKEHKTRLTSIYTPLYIIAGESEEVNSDHEIWQIETANRKQKRQYDKISINDIFGEEQACKRVMTKGVAGVGKTVSVQKFIVDWADGKANQDLDFVICLPFRELNLLRDEERSLLKLMLDFNSTLRPLEGIDFEKHKVLFILDGLDECRFNLNFRDNMPVFRITEDASLDVLLTNLLKGQLLQSALVWVTSRPAAAAVIPSDYIDRYTEVRGFNDEQKVEYFRNKFSDRERAESIIRHVKTTRSLYIMCHIPVFCCITATVLKTMLNQENAGEIPKTLTEMYTHFLYTQLSMSNKKFIGNNISNRKAFLVQNKEAILKLAELAFRKLEGEGGSILFYEDDLKECGIDLTEASVLCGLCTEIFRVEPVMFEKRYYSFVHLSIQEFLAALHIFASFLKRDMQALRPFLTFKPKKMFLYLLLKNVIDKALKSENGHLDLFVRFLLGLCLFQETKNHPLDGLLPEPVDKDKEDDNKSIEETKRYIKNLVHKNLSPERFINLMNCLTELKDSSVHKEMQRYLQYSSNPQTELEPSHCSALANMVLLSDEPLEELDFQRYNLGDGDEAKERLVPAVRWCKKARLFECKLSVHCGEILASALQSDHSPLRQLELKKCPLTEQGLKKLCSALTSDCRLQALSLAGSRSTSDFMCEVLGQALSSSGPHLTELNLSRNMLCSKDVRDITTALKKSSCGVNTLRLQKCSIKEHGCELLAGVLRSEHGNLTELDLRENTLSRCAVAHLSEALKTPQCKLLTLRLSATDITEEASWMCLASAFRGQLDLTESRLTVPELEQLSTALRSPDCSLNTLRLRQCFLKEGHCDVLALVLSSDGCHLAELGWISQRGSS
ncbi:protein NLRC3-like [Engraulis encrasicolus]|uniref:protein NLRC3-like n=1 Tax=Engraulis encrasicolus TaxID=184585 RepID=UPI002FD2DC17